MPTTRANSRTPNATKANSSGKRILSPELQSTNSSSKKSKSNKMSNKEFDELKTLISSLSHSISQKIDDSRNALENKFTDLDNKFGNLASQVNTDVQAIKSTVTEFQNKITKEIDSMNSTLKNHADRIDNNEDDMQCVQLSQDVRLVGFAVKENENLLDIFRKIADEIGFASGDNVGLPTIERMPTKNHTTGQSMLSPTIIIHFNSIRQKQLFYSLYLNKMPLNPEKFGMTCDNRIVIGEHLTKKNAQLFKEAQIMRKNNKIAQTFTENGIVKIRFAKGKNEKTFTIRNQTQLETIVAQNQSTQTHSSTASGTSTDKQLNDSQKPTHTPNTMAPTALNNGVQQKQQQTQGTNGLNNAQMGNGTSQQQHSPMDT